MKKGQQRSYIDIDVTDPFKVPKASEYIDQPLPKYDSYGNKKGNENDHAINYKFDNVKVQTENKVDVKEGSVEGGNREDEQYKDEEYNAGTNRHRYHNDMQEDGPEVPSDQEESPKELEPEPYRSNDEDEHIQGDSRHNVPKADWKQDYQNEQISDHGGHEDSGGPWRNEEGNEEYRRKDNDERRFDQNEEDRDNYDNESGRDHYGGWERRGENNERDDGPHGGSHFGPHGGMHEMAHDYGPEDGPHEDMREGSHEEERGDGHSDYSKDDGREGNSYSRDD